MWVSVLLSAGAGSLTVETEDIIYLVEVTSEDKLNNLDVIAKKRAGHPILCCRIPLGQSYRL